MKNIFFTAIVLAFSTLGLVNTSSAQQFNAGEVAKLNNTIDNTVTTSKSSLALSSKAGNKAFKNFSRHFKNIINADWYVTKDAGFVAYFKNETGNHRVVYNNNGAFSYSLTRLTVEQAPKAVIKDVQRAYDGYRVICAEELWIEGKTIYLVHIQSYTNSKTIRVTEDEMEVIENLSRN